MVLDLRKKSKTYKKWQGFNLDCKKKQILIIPKGCGHAFQSLTDNVEVMYFCSQFYNPAKEAGVRWNDPAFKIAFPWFDTPRFWDEHILSLREQTSLMQEAPIDISL